MKYKIFDKKYHFLSAFDTKTGAYIRTGILDMNGKDTGVDPFMASYPHLIDVGIMGHCIHGKTGLCIKAGIECYQSGLLVEQSNMSVKDFRWIAEQSKGRCNQFALGGRGDPDQHEYFEEILKICQENVLVPNFTTSGYGMTPEIAKLCKKYCGAVAVSWYRSTYTINAIQILLDAHVKTNIHYVLGRNSIDEAIDRLQRNDFPKGINAVIFLLHKPAGQGTKSNVLSADDSRVAEFFSQVDKPHPFKVGMNEQTSAAVEEVRLTNCEFLTVQQVAKILKVNKNTVYDLIGAKLLRAVKLGSTKVATIAVEDFIREMDAGLIEYDTVTKKATRHRAKAKSAAGQNK